MNEEDILRRHFVAVATGAYENFEDLPVAAEVQALRDWLCDPQLGPRRFDEPYPELADGPSKNQIRNALEDPPKPWRASDAAVVFVTGHGVVADDTHLLALRTTDPARLNATALPTADLVKWLQDTDVQALLLILDACHAGRTALDVLRLDRDLPKSWLVLASAGSGQKAATGALTRAVSGFLEQLASAQGEQYGLDRLIKVHDFITEVQRRLGESQTVQVLGGAWPGDIRHPCLPNPHYRGDPAVGVDAARHDLALPQADLRTHWGPRARGVSRDGQRGWLFTGRATLMKELIAATEGAPGTVLITGGAGSGKSAVLARLVTLSDPRFLAEHQAEVRDVPAGLRPTPGAVDVAVVATGKLHTQVLDQICRALAVPAPAGPPDLGAQPRLDAWHSWLAGHDRRITIVVDAVDEADDPAALLSRVLARLDPSGERIRLLIGVRSTGGAPSVALADQAGLRARMIAVDGSPWWHQPDVAAYAASILLNTDGSPYRTAEPATTRAVAQNLGEHAGRSFLLAQIAATALAAQPAAGTDPAAWQDALDQGILGVFRQDLHQSLTDPADRRRAVILLRAVAFARGPGIPWRHVWPRIARAVDDLAGDYGDADIAWLLSSRLGGYLTTDRADDTTVYRLFHDLLRSTLRTRWRELLPAP